VDSFANRRFVHLSHERLPIQPAVGELDVHSLWIFSQTVAGEKEISSGDERDSVERLRISDSETTTPTQR